MEENRHKMYHSLPYDNVCRTALAAILGLLNNGTIEALMKLSTRCSAMHFSECLCSSVYCTAMPQHGCKTLVMKAKLSELLGIIGQSWAGQSEGDWAHKKLTIGAHTQECQGLCFYNVKHMIILIQLIYWPK